MPATMIELTPLLLRRCRDYSDHRAPWAVFDGPGWEFLLAAAQSGIHWKACSKSLDRWLLPETNTEKRRQLAASQLCPSDAQLSFFSGIGLWERHYLGGMTGTGWQGDGENYYAPTTSPVPSEDADLARALAVFWPQIPALVWTQVRSLLSVRSRQVEELSYGATAEFAVDQIDAAGLYRFLRYSQKLTPAQQAIDWKMVIDATRQPEVITNWVAPHSTDQPQLV